MSNVGRTDADVAQGAEAASMPRRRLCQSYRDAASAISTGPFATCQIAISDTVRSAPSPLLQGPTVIISSTVAVIFLIAITNAFPARNGKL